MRFLRAAVLLTATTALGALATPARAQVTGIDLSTMGISAPTIDVGTTAVQAGTVQYSNSGGSSDAFSVGTSTSISASASASSTPDYSVNSNANFGETHPRSIRSSEHLVPPTTPVQTAWALTLSVLPQLLLKLL